MDGPLDVDEIWKQLGTWGRYQRKQLAFCLIAVIPVAFHLLSIVFIAYRPPHMCKETDTRAIFPDQVESNTSYKFVYDKCSIDVFTNETNATYVTTRNCIAGYSYDIPKDRTIATEWDLVCSGGERAELTQTLVILGQAFGAVIFPSLADKFGRKPVHIFSHFAMFAIAFGTGWSPNYVVFAILRICIGAVQQGAGLPVAILAMEFVPSHVRYLVEIGDLVFWTTGVAIMAPFAYIFRNMSWRYLQMALGICSAYSVLEYWLIDESLRWLLANGRRKEAEKMIRKAAKINGKQYHFIIHAAAQKAKEMENFLSDKKYFPPETKTSSIITKALVSESTENGESKNQIINDQSSKDVVENTNYNAFTIFKHKRLLVNSCILWYTWCVNSIVYYTLYLTSITFSGNPYLNFFLMAIVEYPAAVAEWIAIKKLGRRKSCLLFHFLAGVSLAVSTVCLLYKGQIQSLGNVALAFNLLGKFFITASFSTIFLYTPELYPTNLRNAGVGLASSFSRAGGMLASFSVPLANYNQWLPGTISSVLCLGTVYLTSLLPETSGRELPTTIEELDLWYKDIARNTSSGKKDEIRNNTEK